MRGMSYLSAQWGSKAPCKNLDAPAEIHNGLPEISFYHPSFPDSDAYHALGLNHKAEFRLQGNRHSVTTVQNIGPIPQIILDSDILDLTCTMAHPSTNGPYQTIPSMSDPYQETFPGTMNLNDSGMTPAQQAFWREHWYMTEDQRRQYWNRRTAGYVTQPLQYNSSRPSTVSGFRTSSTSASGYTVAPNPVLLPSQRYAGSYNRPPNPFASTQANEPVYSEDNWNTGYSDLALSSPDRDSTYQWPQPSTTHTQPNATGELYGYSQTQQSGRRGIPTPRQGGGSPVEQRTSQRLTTPYDDPLLRTPRMQDPYSERQVPRATIPSYLGDPFSPGLNSPQSPHGGNRRSGKNRPSTSQTSTSNLSMRVPSSAPSMSSYQNPFSNFQEPITSEAPSTSTPSRSRSRSSRGEDINTSLSATHPFPCTFPKCGARLKDRYEWKRHEVIHVRADVWFCMPDNNAILDGKCAFCESDDVSPRHFADHNLSLCWAKPAHERAFHRKDHLKQHIQALHTPKDHDGRLYRKIEKAWHRREEPPEAALQCPYCGTVFENWEKRVSHVGQSLKAASALGRGGLIDASICSRKMDGP